MANKKIEIDIIINSAQSAKTVGELKNSLEQIKGTLSKIGDEAGEDFTRLNSALNDVSGKLNNVGNAAGSAVNPLEKLKLTAERFDGISKTLSGSISLAAGAFGIFGGAGEKVAATLVKVQSAIAISNGVKDLSEGFVKLATTTSLASAAQAAYTAVVGTSTGALKLFRLALVATGIGAIVVGLGLLIANWEEVNEVIDDSIDKFKDLGVLGKIALAPLIASLAPLILLIKGVQTGLEELGLIESKQEKERKVIADKQLKRIRDEKKAQDELNAKKLTDIDKEIARNESLGKSVDALNIKRKEEEIAINAKALAEAELYLALVKRYGFATEADREFVEGIRKSQEDLQFDLEILNNKQSTANKEKNAEIAEDNKKTNEDIEAANLKLAEQTKLANTNLIADEKLKAEELAKISFEKRQEEIINSKADNDVKNAAIKASELTYQAELVKITDDANAKKLAIEAKAIEDAKQLKITALNEELAGIDTQLVDVEKGSVEELNLLQERLNTETDIKLESVKAGSEAEKLILAQYFADATALEDEYLVNQKTKQEQAGVERRQAISDGLNEAASAINDIGQLTNAIFDAQLTKSDEKYKKQLEGVEKGSQAEYEILVKKTNEENKIKKKQFEANKKLQIANAIVTTAQAALGAFTQAIISYPPPIGAIVGGIQAAVAVGIGVAQIAKIKATTFDGAALPSAPSSTGGGGISAPTSGTVNTPSLSSTTLFGNSANLNTGGGSNNQSSGVRAYVVESDVTDTQNRLNRFRTDAEIG
jgi:hypothetical protein